MQRFLVTIAYREPTYERHRKENVRRIMPYSARYEVEATNEEAARKLALGAFRRVAAASSSGWVRQVESVEVAAISEDVVTQLPGEDVTEDER